MNAFRYIFYVFLQAITVSAFCQRQNIRFEHLGTDQGLSQSNVICILQDSRGFMWFGTRDGLNKYDGYKFTVYENDVHNSNSLSGNFIKTIFESKNGDLWIGTIGGGLSKFNRQKNFFTNFRKDPKNANSISDDIINSIIEDGKGNLWIGTQGGLDMFDRQRNRFVRYIHNANDENSLSDDYVRNVFEDGQGNLWVGTFYGGLNLFNPKSKTFTHFKHDEKKNSSISNDNVYTMFEDSRHRFWVGTNGGGLNLFDRERREFTSYKHDDAKNHTLAGNTVYAINEDDQGKIWIGTENGGLSILDPVSGVFQNYRNDEVDNASLSNNSIYSIYRDTKDNMWLGTFNGGINLVSADAGKFKHYKHNSSENSLSDNNVLCIYEDSQKNIWVGTDGGGLNLFDRRTGEFTRFMHDDKNKNSICGNYVLGVCEDSKGNLWIGTWGNGVTVFNRSKNTFKHFRNDPNDPASLSSNNAWKIYQDKEKNIWIGTYGGGLNLFDPVKNSFAHYTHDVKNPEGISSNNIYSILEDGEGKLWISTDGGGLNLFDRKKKTFSHFLHDDKMNSISDNSVGSMYEDKNGNLWIGTMRGLTFFDKKKDRFTNYTTADGLPNEVVFGILQEGTGKLWISTNKGISNFDPITKQFKNFTPADGLQGNEFKQQAYCKASDGTMYFGGTNGFNQFLPDDITVKSFEPPMIITSFQIFGNEVPISSDSLASPLKKDISETDEITIPYKSSVISFEFASLNYGARGKRQYAYMLDGFDQTWNNIGTRRLATYTNLDAGDYVFKVRTMNNDGNWSGKTTEVRLIITPPFWKTWWFRSISVLFVVGSFITFYRLRIRAITKQKEQLEKLVIKRTQELVLQKEEKLKAEIDKAVSQGKFEIASDVMHDIGNAVVGFGSHLTRLRRLQEVDKPENLQNLAGFFEDKKNILEPSIGEAKTEAVIKMLNGMAQTQKKNHDEINKTIAEQLNIIAHIQEILNIQRQYINGHESAERQPVNLRNVINDCLAMLFGSIDKAGIVVSLNIAVDKPIVKGDRTKLMQLILNILKNSIEAIDKNALEKQISITVCAHGDSLRIQIKDSGTGFAKETSDHLFSKGFSTKSAGGLGLYNCQTILQSHDATIDIFSEGRNKGALTTVQFKKQEKQF